MFSFFRSKQSVTFGVTFLSPLFGGGQDIFIQWFLIPKRGSDGAKLGRVQRLADELGRGGSFLRTERHAAERQTLRDLLKYFMRILVTGGAGFIGSHLVRLLLWRGHEVLSIDKLTYAGNRSSLRDIGEHPAYQFLRADIRDGPVIRAAFQEFQPSAVVHLAAESSERGEYEITAVNQEYLRQGRLNVTLFNRGVAWLDTGTFASLNEASTFVRVIEERQGTKIGCIEEVAYYCRFIDKNQLLRLSERYPASPYGEYLKEVAGG